MFEEMSPMSLAVALLGGVAVYAVMSYSNVGLIWKLAGFVVGGVMGLVIGNRSFG